MSIFQHSHCSPGHTHLWHHKMCGVPDEENWLGDSNPLVTYISYILLFFKACKKKKRGVLVFFPSQCMLWEAVKKVTAASDELVQLVCSWVRVEDLNGCFMAVHLSHLCKWSAAQLIEAQAAATHICGPQKDFAEVCSNSILLLFPFSSEIHDTRICFLAICVFSLKRLPQTINSLLKKEINLLSSDLRTNPSSN